MITKLIEEKYNTFFYKTNKYLVGSASSAIYIYLKHKQLDNQNILLPSNICHSIPFSIIYSGNKPLFYDVDSLTGNPSLDSIKKILNKNSVAAIIIPNMYGNIFIDRGSLIEFIEDRAGHDVRYAIDASKISKELSWFPKETFITGIEKTIRWYLENLNWSSQFLNLNLEFDNTNKETL